VFKKISTYRIQSAGISVFADNTVFLVRDRFICPPFILGRIVLKTVIKTVVICVYFSKSFHVGLVQLSLKRFKLFVKLPACAWYGSWRTFACSGSR